MRGSPVQRIETTRLKDHRPWAERTGAAVLLLVLAAGTFIAFVAEKRQRREVCRRTQENLGSIAWLLSNRFNLWYAERAKAAGAAAARLEASPLFAQAFREGHGTPALREQLEQDLLVGGFQAGGVVLPSGRWMEGTACGDLTSLCPAPDQRDPLRGAVQLHGPLDRPHLDLARPALPSGGPRPKVVFLVEPLPEMDSLLVAQLPYRSRLSLLLVARDGPGARVLWASPGHRFEKGAYLPPPLPPAIAQALDGVLDVLPPEQTGDSLAAVSYLATVRWGIVATMPVDDVVAPIRTTAGLAWGLASLLFVLGATTMAWLYRRSYWRTLREGAALSKALVGRLLQAGEAERLQFSHELHDGLVPFLTAARLRHAAAMDEQASPGERKLASVQVGQLLAESQAECRRLIEVLRPPVLDGGHLVSALCDMARERGALWTCRDVSDQTVMSLEDEAKGLLYRIAQEALANAARHAGARRVSLSVWSEGADLVMEVRDDGRGFDSKAPRKKNHFGLAVMMERAALAGGRLTVVSSPGAGTSVRVAVPLPPSPIPEEGDP